MPNARRFDWDDAKRRVAAGETMASLAREYGVTRAAVRFAIDDEFRIKQRALRGNWDRKHQDECPTCGGLKNITSTYCWDCRAELRLSGMEHLQALPKPGVLDYYREGERYGLLAVSGHSHVYDWGTSFSIVDTHNMGQEVKRKRVRFIDVPEARKQLIALVKEWNRQDRKADARA